jgi:cell division protein FtsW (lipid II flippase)
MKKVFSTIKSFLKETDILLFSLCVITSAFGLLMVYSATRYTLKDGAHFSREFIIMLLAIFLGIIAALFLSYFDYQVYTKFWPVLCIIAAAVVNKNKPYRNIVHFIFDIFYRFKKKR